jgi:HEAT repeat protein
VGRDEIAAELLKISDFDDDRLRIGIAATLGDWGDRRYIDFLRKSLENLDLGDERSRPFYSVVRVLASLGDRSLIPSLVSKISSASEANRVTSIMYVAQAYNDEQLTNAGFAAGCRLAKSGDADAIYLLALTLRENNVAEAFEVMRTAPHNTHDIFSNQVVKKVGDVGSRVEDVRELMAWKRERGELPDWELNDDIDEAIFKVSRRAKVRMFSEGRIEPW